MQRGVEEVCWYLYGTMHVGSCGKRLNFCETQPDYFETQPDFYRAQPEKPGRKHMRTSHRKHFIRAKASQKGAAYAEQRLIGLIGAGPSGMTMGRLNGWRRAVLEKRTVAAAEASAFWTWITTGMRGQRPWYCAKNSVIRR